MYLKQVMVENSGPLRRLDLEPAFSANGAPKPLVLVGSNGGGKTNLLSLVTDALFEAAAVHYSDVLPTVGIGRAWFRIVGGRTTTLGAPGSFSLLRFEHEDEDIIYKEKAGDVDPSEAQKRVSPQLRSAINWKKEGTVKEFAVSEDQSRLIFQQGVYAYFPSSRSEVPFWLNRESVPETEFDLFTRISKRLRKPIYVEKSLQEFKQWVISLILESRLEVGYLPGNPPQFQIGSDADRTIASIKALDECNSILRRILDDDQVRFVWLGRNSPDKLAVARNGDLVLPNLDALSGGQSILLGLFGTLLRYADESRQDAVFDLSATAGICLVDEIDAHLHVDLQYKSLPNLIELFPRIQFIVSSHSPLFVLGMKQKFGEDGFQLIEMPGGNTVTSETYSEFGRAMEALAASEAFNKKVLSEVVMEGLPMVLVEGETDAPYLRAAAKALGRSQLLERCEIQWIGAKDQNGQGFHTGKGALDRTLSVLRANPKLSNRVVLLLYDNDAKKADADFGDVAVRSMPTNGANNKVTAGIENLLPETAITNEDYQTIESRKPNGEILTRKVLRKAELCERTCASNSEADFSAFGLALDVIEGYLDSRDNSPQTGHT